MASVIRVGDHEIETGCTPEGGRFHPTVMVRTNKAKGEVRAVGYVFEQSFATQGEALREAESLAEQAAKYPDRHLAGADGKFA